MNTDNKTQNRAMQYRWSCSALLFLNATTNQLIKIIIIAMIVITKNGTKKIISRAWKNKE